MSYRLPCAGIFKFRNRINLKMPMRRDDTHKPQDLINCIDSLMETIGKSTTPYSNILIYSNKVH